ncbi:MAG: 2-C-methyl-D-erythritol 2,4-cyclodiphosphate synthase [Planctomycetaceae bacterium]|jgi:2-C-methyl-D-erythritol 2,4-cyclodiphosphate synthase|nr:2-C-methyl-D-erythritol 2,4-cyclodiphosphate synthase [Planctomycetaceae bacterium]
MIEQLRIGIGHDTHRLGTGNYMMIGGVRIEYSRTLLGHSDADVLLHAISDALLGATGCGDIGEMFPDTEPTNANIDSAIILKSICSKIYSENWKVINIDTIIFAEKPKFSPYKEKIRNRIAEIISINPSQINIKAKTGEHIGIIGREEAISAQCVALLYKKNATVGN